MSAVVRDADIPSPSGYAVDFYRVKPSRLKVISRLRGLDDEARDGRDFQPDGPLWVLVVRPLVEHDPAVTPEV